MIDEFFAEGRSPIHRSSPAVRVAAATGYSFTVALMHDPASLLAALVFSTGLVLLARLPGNPLIRRLRAAGALLALIWLILPLTYPGDPLIHVGPLALSRQGALLSLVISLKTTAILLAYTALLATMHLSTLGHTLRRLGLPAKLVHLLLLAYRYIFVIEQEYQRLYRAARMRNFRPGSNLHTYRTYAYLVGMLFVRASERARRVHLAMKCRGFNGQFHCLRQYSRTAWNPVLIAGVGLFSLALIGIDLLGYGFR
jgi:cobalt/nickel transport system permease protein